MLKSSEALANLDQMDRATLISMVKFYRKQEQRAKEAKLAIAVDTSARDALINTRIQDALKSNALDLSELGLQGSVPLDNTIREKIHKLILTKNEMTQFPSEFCRFPKLQEIVCTFNQLNQLNPQFTLEHLKILDLSNNNFTTIPSILGSCPQLTHLNMSSNQISSWPDNLQFVAGLTHLNLQKNQITGISPSIAALVQLEDMDLRSNKITKLPSIILQLTNLSYLSMFEILIFANFVELGGNPLVSPPTTIISKGLQAILNFLKEGTLFPGLSSTILETDSEATPATSTNRAKASPFTRQGSTPSGPAYEKCQTENKQLKECLANLAREYSSLRNKVFTHQ
jgi:hypothetical protein